ncbi:MAG: hypothetical protein LBO77_03790 [Desulfovibrio sp.]|jgi:hypothetical protein|nr:hypothetical protein [Desulfovibrio sp.]
MPTLSFAKLHPGGNTTIILLACGLGQEELARASAVLMSPLHLGAEQVGELFMRRPVPHLQMMGGECCVNAVRSAALLLARAGLLRPVGTKGCGGGRITVSGALAPLDILACAREDALLEALSLSPENSPPDALLPPLPDPRLFCAARMACGAGSTRILPVEPGVHLVHMPGICHLLVDAAIRPLPRNWRAGSADLRQQAGIANAPASGVVWYECRDGAYHITPAVEVKATASEHLETACGSASLAMALLHAATQADPGSPLAIVQPSGETLKVTLFSEPAADARTRGAAIFPSQAWVSGRVGLVAEGLAHIP